MKAKSINGDSLEEIKYALNQSMTDGFQPTVAIMFLSIKLDKMAVAKIFHDNDIDVIGATTAGEFAEGYQGEGSAVILLLDLNPESFAIKFQDVVDKSVEQVSKELAELALNDFDKPAFILLSTSLNKKGEFFDGEKLVGSIEIVLGSEVNIFGGMAGDDGTFTGTYVFNHERSTDNGIIALVLDQEKIDLQGVAISGWKPLGIQRTITKSKGRLIYEIDGQSALDMYLKYLGNEDFAGMDKFKMFEDIGVHYPFQVERENGNPAMVTPMDVDKNEYALICESIVPEGSKIHFSMPPDFDIVETILEKAADIKKSTQINADALLIFSCIGRLTAMGPFATQENEGLAELWNAPMAGFFSYGEYGNSVNGKPEFHSTTCSWVAISEKDHLK
ncbi:MAG: FIST N-terminal domain-containing protein [Melioribacteraceae bacterium]|nr:FIST N-terminal domain-containing protein [Melioribacteraceae bacterium]